MKEGQPSHPVHSALSDRMDPFQDTLRRLREAFKSGRTWPAEFRAAQLQGLGRFLQENKQLLQDALAQDLHKVGRGGCAQAGAGAASLSSFRRVHAP